MIAAVLADPDADAPRRAVAEQLQAAGDPRGRFIAVQLQAVAERRRAGDSAEYRAVAATAAAMLARHEHAWAGELASLAPRFYRGFVEGVTLDARAFLDGGEALYRAAPIRHVIVTDAAQLIDELAGSPLLARLASLGVQGAPIGDRGALALAGSHQLAKLRRLDLSRNAITAAGLDALAASPGLARVDYINLAGNPAGAPGETVAYDSTTGAAIAGTAELPALGRALEARHGTRPWLHAPSRLRAYPPLEVDV